MKAIDFWFWMEILFAVFVGYSYFVIHDLFLTAFFGMFVMFFLALVIWEDKKRRKIREQLKNASRMGREC